MLAVQFAYCIIDRLLFQRKGATWCDAAKLKVWLKYTGPPERKELQILIPVKEEVDWNPVPFFLPGVIAVSSRLIS